MRLYSHHEILDTLIGERGTPEREKYNKRIEKYTKRYEKIHHSGIELDADGRSRGTREKRC